MTDEELAAIEARANAATAGPWEINWVDDETAEMGSVSLDRRVCYLESTGEEWGRDPTVQFISRARTDVPEMVAELKVYRRALLDACGDLAGQAGGTAESWAEKLVADARADLAA
jgi:hypothetical protein